MMELCDDNIMDILSFLPIKDVLCVKDVDKKMQDLVETHMMFRLPHKIKDFIDGHTHCTGYTMKQALCQINYTDDRVVLPQKILVVRCKSQHFDKIIVCSDTKNITKIIHKIYNKLCVLSTNEYFDFCAIDDHGSNIFINHTRGGVYTEIDGCPIDGCLKHEGGNILVSHICEDGYIVSDSGDVSYAYILGDRMILLYDGIVRIASVTVLGNFEI